MLTDEKSRKQGLAANARGEGVAPGEQQAPPKADDGQLDTPLPRPALSRY